MVGAAAAAAAAGGGGRVHGVGVGDGDGDGGGDGDGDGGGGERDGDDDDDDDGGVAFVADLTTAFIDALRGFLSNPHAAPLTEAVLKDAIAAVEPAFAKSHRASTKSLDARV